MNKKNYSKLIIIKRLLTVFSILLFVNVGWSQTAQALPFTLPNTAVRADLISTNGWSYTGIGTDYNSSGTNIKFDTSSDFAVLKIASSPSAVTYNLKGNGLSGAYVFQLSESDTGETFSLVQSITSGIGNTNTVFQSNLLSTTRYIKWTYINKATGNIGFGGVNVAAILNTVPTVSDVAIVGLPNTGVALTSSYQYNDLENDIDASTYQWYTANDAFGSDAAAIVEATNSSYTLTSNELGKYIQLGVLAGSATGVTPGVESFSPWIGPVNSAGTPVLNAGILSDFSATCINTTTSANSFTLMGNNLESNVTLSALPGFTFSLSENGTYTTTLPIAPFFEELNVVVYVKFTPTLVQSYNGMIAITGGGAAALDVSVVASGINTPVTVSSGSTYGLSATGATVETSFTDGCSVVTAYGIEYSTTEGFLDGEGIMQNSTNENAGNFTVNLTGLQSNTTYYYKLYATDGTGTIYGLQDSFMTGLIETPTANSASAVTLTGFTANWEAVTGATGYELDVYEKVLSPSPNLVVNSGFENENLNPWSFQSSMSEAISLAQFNTGASSLYATVTATKNFNQTIAVESGTTYVLKFSYFIDASSTGNGFRVWTTEGADIKLPSSSTFYSEKGSWLEVEETFTASAASLILNMRLYNGVKVYFDDFQIKKALPSVSIDYVSGYQDLFVEGTSQGVEGLNFDTNYFYVVRALDTNSTSTDSNEISVNTLESSTTYENGVWSNGAPTIGVNAIFLSDYTTTSNLEAKTLTVNDGIFTVATGTALTVANAIINNSIIEGIDTFVVENNAVVLQTNSVTNVGEMKVIRNSADLYRQDYVLWSSPVTGQNLRAFSPQTLFNRFSSYDNTIGTNGDYLQEITTTLDMNTKTFTNAKGYLVRMPNNWVEYNAGAAVSYAGMFKGTLNNGDFTIPLSGENNKLNLVGNPYPSPISIASFFAKNTNLDETLYFWRKQSSANPANSGISGYATYNSIGFTSADLSINNDVPTNIQTGQGFFVVSNTTNPGNLVFNNAMRTDATATFYKTANENVTDLNRLWLNLSNDTNLVGQTLIGYALGATEGVDSSMDALYFNDAPLALTSIINNKEYIIQGRSLPFFDTDIVHLGFKTDISGSFTISLDSFDGLFSENQAIYLKDNLTGSLQNLKLADYTFTTPVGIFNERFEVHYNNSTLNTENPQVSNQNILIAVNNQKININSGTLIMEKIELIDISGRVIYTQEGLNTSIITLENVVTKNQVLIVRINTKDNNIVNQKIIF
jgi:hypothetical protein